MGAAFLCAIAGIANEHTDRNTTAYIQNWISKLEEDNRLIVHAAANAQRAVDLILGSTFEEEKETTRKRQGCRCQRHPRIHWDVVLTVRNELAENPALI